MQTLMELWEKVAERFTQQKQEIKNLDQELLALEVSRAEKASWLSLEGFVGHPSFSCQCSRN